MPGRNGRGENFFNGRRLFTTKKTGDGIGMAWASNVTEQNGGFGFFFRITKYISKSDLELGLLLADVYKSAS